MNILLCTFEEGFRGISIRYLSSYLKKQGHTVKMLFLNRRRTIHSSASGFNEKEISEILDFIKAYEIDFVGLSIMTEFFLEAKNLIAQCKKLSPKTKFVVGGVHATTCPEECIETGADAVVIGDGEVPLSRLLCQEPLNNISGICFKSDEQIIINKPIDTDMVSLPELPFPDWHFKDTFFLDDSKIKKLGINRFRAESTWKGTYYPLITSRGCPYRCSFCCNVNRGKARRNSIDNIIEELLYIKKCLPFTLGVNIQDDCFFMGSDSYIFEFSDKVKKKLGWPFVARLMPHFVTEERIIYLKERGLEYVSMGLQGNDRLNGEIYERPEKSEDFLRATRLLHKYNVNYVVDVLLDNPYEREEDLRQITTIINNTPKPFGVNAFSLTPFPGTKLFTRTKEDGSYSRFASDPYEGQTFLTYSFFTKLYRHGAVQDPAKYKTPASWQKLIQGIAPMASKRVVEQILHDGVFSKQSVKKIDKMYKYYGRLLRLSNWMKEENIFLFRLAKALYTKFIYN